MLRLVARVLIARQHGLCRAGVEAITIRTRIRKGRLSLAQRVGRRERYRLDPKFIRPQQTPDTLGFGRRQDFGGSGQFFKQAIVRGE